MSVVLFSDGASQRTSDEHTAFDLSAGRTLLPMCKTEKPDSDPLLNSALEPAPEPSHPAPPPPTNAEDSRDEEPRRDLPASAYMATSG